MHLVKGIRKNERKLMVFLLIFIMIAFVGGSALMQILQRFSAGAVRKVARYGDKSTITNKDLMFARSELDVLRMLQVPQFLVSQQAFTGGPDLKMRFLSQLLFADSNLALAINDEIKNTQKDTLRCGTSRTKCGFNEKHIADPVQPAYRSAKRQIKTHHNRSGYSDGMYGRSTGNTRRRNHGTGKKIHRHYKRTTGRRRSHISKEEQHSDNRLPKRAF